ncbi:MAG: nitroreductase/quinone reductase family protein [Ilumatobacteraceae bacterium]
MGKWPVSDEQAREMYVGGRGNEAARRFARLWAKVFAAGLFPRRWVTLEVPGHRTGRVARFPLGMADVGGKWYLVSMLGECAWVRNVRAADGRAVLRRRRPRQVRLVEVPVADRAPILRRYVDKVPGGRPHIPLDRSASLAEFEAIAESYPVFEVLRL